MHWQSLTLLNENYLRLKEKLIIQSLLTNQEDIIDNPPSQLLTDDVFALHVALQTVKVHFFVG